MRRVALLVAALVIVAAGTFSAPPSWADEADCPAQKVEYQKDGTGQVECVASARTTRPGGAYRPPGPAVRARLRRPTPEIVNVPALTYVPPVGVCRTRTTETVLRSELAAMPADANLPFWMRFTAPYPRCPTVQAVPEDVAVEVLERVPLPAPKPFIAPGFAITGKLA